MLKSLDSMLVGYTEALFEDLKMVYGSPHDWGRDKSRLLHELEARGERIFTIDLPPHRKHLDRCLDEGLYVQSNLLLASRVSKEVVVPAFLRDLYLQIFYPDGRLRDDASVTAIRSLRQLFDSFGKLKRVCDGAYVNDEVDTFVRNEAELRSPSLSWDADFLFMEGRGPRDVCFCDHPDLSGGLRADQGELFSSTSSSDAEVPTRRDLLTLQSVADRIASAFGDFHEEEDRELPKHGPGRVADLKKTDSKFLFRSWPTKAHQVFPFDRYGVPNLGAPRLGDDSSFPDSREHPSKLIAVPKTATGPRLIGSEPSYHQFLQQLVRAQIERRISRTPLRNSITFGDQEPNRSLAQSSSANGLYATVDLKSASDRLSCWTVERALRANQSFLERIHASRTRTMRNAINEAFGVIKLRKCFTQGSACTFPVQSIIYAMIAISSVVITEDVAVSTLSIERASRQVRVFGDDIIVPTKALPTLVRLLAALQLRVNLAKTFYQGKFRESCGMDAYDGQEVTPIRIRRLSANATHSDLNSMIETSNNLFLAGWWYTSDWLRAIAVDNAGLELPILKVRKDPRTGALQSDSRGLASFVGDKTSHLRMRYSETLHRHEVRIHFLASKSKKVLNESADDLYEFLLGTVGRGPLNVLEPREGGLGRVVKEASVMRRGWKPIETLGNPKDDRILNMRPKGWHA